MTKWLLFCLMIKGFFSEARSLKIMFTIRKKGNACHFMDSNIKARRKRLKRRAIVALISIFVGLLTWTILFLRHDPETALLEKMAEMYDIKMYYIDQGKLVDMVEKSHDFKDAFHKMNEIAASEANAYGLQGRARIHYINRTTKRLLKENYGIEWRSEIEMNPWINY